MPLYVNAGIEHSTSFPLNKSETIINMQLNRDIQNKPNSKPE